MGIFGERKSKAEEYIPKGILRAARAAGLEDPLWYVGPRAATPEERARLEAEMPDLNEVIENAYREEGKEPPERVELPPRNDGEPPASS
ncbi:MAG TPA: hypothetical protein VHC21_03545 [Candidatus Saccharimonadales bacterium]|nr:hypothetical protein [Candidatus Saccharimonadales bacterium]